MERLVIAVEDRNLLGAGEQTSGGARGAARRNGLRILQIVGLIRLQRTQPRSRKIPPVEAKTSRAAGRPPSICR